MACTSWYNAPMLMGYLDTVTTFTAGKQPFAMPVLWVNRPHADFGGHSGTVAHGQIQAGYPLRVTAAGQQAMLTCTVALGAHSFQPQQAKLSPCIWTAT